MKEFSAFFNKDIIKSIIYKVVPKFAIGLTVILLWDKYINKNDYYSVVEFGFFIMGVFFALMAWFNYLKSDGIKVSGFGMLKEKKNIKHKTIHWSKDMIDFADEPAPTFDNLSDDQQNMTSLISNIIAGLMFLIPSLVSIIIY